MRKVQIVVHPANTIINELIWDAAVVQAEEGAAPAAINCLGVAAIMVPVALGVAIN